MPPTHAPCCAGSSGCIASTGSCLALLAVLSSHSAGQRIAQRFDSMLQNGFIDEVRRLEARGDLHADLPSIRCVGYRQAWEYLDGAITYDELHFKGIAATRQLAKRQLTWQRQFRETWPGFVELEQELKNRKG